MWWLLALLTAASAEESCAYVSFADVVADDAPAVIVLGERHGHQPDLARAAKVVRTLAARGPVRVALEAVRRTDQSVIDRFEKGELDADLMPEHLDWEGQWGFAWKPYAPLVLAGAKLDGVHVVGAGLPLGPKPDDAQLPVPPRYIDLLRTAMGQHPMPLEQEGRFVLSMAWRDHQIAEAALEGWNGKGYVVIVTGRGHVEGGKGVAWQAQRMTSVPIASYVLTPGKEPPCHPGDLLWR